MSPVQPSYPQLAVSAAIFRDGKILLVRHAKSPARGFYSLPGGRVEFGETLHAALHREVAEETALKVEIVDLAAWREVGVKAFQSNVPPHLVQRWLGHASLKTTAIYGDVIGPEERAFAARMWKARAERRKGSRWRSCVGTSCSRSGSWPSPSSLPSSPSCTCSRSSTSRPAVRGCTT